MKCIVFYVCVCEDLRRWKLQPEDTLTDDRGSFALKIKISEGLASLAKFPRGYVGTQFFLPTFTILISFRRFYLYRRILARSRGPLPIARRPAWTRFFRTFERTIRRVQKCPDPHLYLFILKSPTWQEVLIYSANGILLSDSCGTGHFRIPCDNQRHNGLPHRERFLGPPT